MKKKVFLVDVPFLEDIDGDVEMIWANIGRFDSREEAIKFIQENIDSSSKDGSINLISEGEINE